MNTIINAAIADTLAMAGDPDQEFLITPVVAAIASGEGTTMQFRELAERNGLEYVEFRAPQLDFRDFQDLPKLKNGEVVYEPVRMVGMDLIQKGPCLVVIDEPLYADDITLGILRQIARHATQPMTLVLPVTTEHRDHARDLAVKGLSMSAWKVYRNMTDEEIASSIAWVEHDAEAYRDHVMRFAETHGFPEHIRAYLDDSEDFGGASIRAWNSLSEVEKDPAVNRQILDVMRAGLLGVGPAGRYTAWLQTNRERFPNA